MTNDYVQPLLSVRNVTLRYRTTTHLVTATHRVSFDVHAGDRLILLGPSGCGKSSLLKSIGGYVRPDEGQILLRGLPVSKPGPDRAMVFQEFDQLMPWKTVRENVAFAVRNARGLDRHAAIESADAVLEKVGLTKFAEAHPHTLSGGMKQRVAIARCLAMQAQIVLMDEPFASLDALTRQKMQTELRTLWEGSELTLIFVTHSIPEAVALGTRIVLLSPHPGRLRAEMTVEEFGRHKLHQKIEEMLFDETVEYAI